MPPLPLCTQSPLSQRPPNRPAAQLDGDFLGYKGGPHSDGKTGDTGSLHECVRLRVRGHGERNVTWTWCIHKDSADMGIVTTTNAAGLGQI